MVADYSQGYNQLYCQCSIHFPVPSGFPENFSGVALSSVSILLMWDPPALQHRNGIITGYVMNITALSTGEILQVFTSDGNYTVDSLKPFTAYSFIIAASTSVGIGPFSTDLTIQTLEDGKNFAYFKATHNRFTLLFTAPTRQPSNSTGFALNSTHIYLMWDSPPPEHINGIIREYQINITELETGDLLQYTTGPDTRELVVGPLHPYYTYHSTIVTFTIEVGPNTTVITVRTEEDGEYRWMFPVHDILTESSIYIFKHSSIRATCQLHCHSK